MRAIDLSAVKWRKSSYSNSTGGDCIEVAQDLVDGVPVRDSKQVHGPVLAFAVDGWTAFVTALKRGELGS